jgi:RHS repeat-associated protein
MAMTVTYTTINGQILSENRNGVKSDYIPDPLGSTAALVNASHTITDTFSWWPFGEQRSHAGSSVTPFGFTGTLGCYTDSISNRIYEQRRILRPQTTQWQTVDPLWPYESAYSYVGQNPISATDPSGYSAIGSLCGYLNQVEKCLALIRQERDKAITNCGEAFDAATTGCRDSEILKELGYTYVECMRIARRDLRDCRHRWQSIYEDRIAICWSDPGSLLNPHFGPPRVRGRRGFKHP